MKLIVLWQIARVRICWCPSLFVCLLDVLNQYWLDICSNFGWFLVLFVCPTSSLFLNQNIKSLSYVHLLNCRLKIGFGKSILNKFALFGQIYLLNIRSLYLPVGTLRSTIHIVTGFQERTPFSTIIYWLFCGTVFSNLFCNIGTYHFIESGKPTVPLSTELQWWSWHKREV